MRVFKLLRSEGYFDEAFGYHCVDVGYIQGSVPEVDLEILLKIRKKGLWPIEDCAKDYSEHDLFDVMEFLHQYVSKPIKGTMHSWNECGMHWDVFDQDQGRQAFRGRINEVLGHYNRKYELSPAGEILHKPEVGFELLIDADMPTKDSNIRERRDAAVLRFRRYGATPDDRRHAVRDLADILEYLRPQVKKYLTSKDESDLFELANTFGIRHHNDKQKTDYDADLWLRWMFYFYLATIHVVTRKISGPGSQV